MAILFLGGGLVIKLSQSSCKCSNNLWDMSAAEHKQALSLHLITAPGPVRVHVPWIVGHRGPAPFSLHRQLRPGTPLCAPGQQPQRAGSQGHWQVHSRTTADCVPQNERDQMLCEEAAHKSSNILIWLINHESGNNWIDRPHPWFKHLATSLEYFHFPLVYFK